MSETLYVMAQMLGAEVNPAVVIVWCDILEEEGISIEEFNRACKEILKTRKYTKLPTPAEVLDLLRPKEDLKAIAEDQATLVLHQIGQRRVPSFEDPITLELMQSRWKWCNFCDTLKTDDVPFWRRDFVEAYSGKRKIANSRKMLPAKEPKQIEGKTK